MKVINTCLKYPLDDSMRVDAMGAENIIVGVCLLRQKVESVLISGQVYIYSDYDNVTQSGWAEDHGPVSITEKFALHAESGYIRRPSEGTLHRGALLKDDRQTISFSNKYVIILCGLVLAGIIGIVYRYVYLNSTSKKKW